MEAADSPFELEFVEEAELEGREDADVEVEEEEDTVEVLLMGDIRDPVVVTVPEMSMEWVRIYLLMQCNAYIVRMSEVNSWFRYRVVSCLEKLQQGRYTGNIASDLIRNFHWADHIPGKHF